MKKVAIGHLENNLALWLIVAEYAKLTAPRSANQSYLKRDSSFKDKVRQTVLLGATRSSIYVVRDEQQSIVPDPTIVQRSNLVEGVMTDPGLSLKQKCAQLEPNIKQCRKDDFWNPIGYNQLMTASSPMEHVE